MKKRKKCVCSKRPKYRKKAKSVKKKFKFPSFKKKSTPKYKKSVKNKAYYEKDDNYYESKYS